MILLSLNFFIFGESFVNLANNILTSKPTSDHKPLVKGLSVL